MVLWQERWSGLEFLNHCSRPDFVWVLRTGHASTVVERDKLGVEVVVDGVVVGQLYHLFKSVVDEDEADECRETLLGETGEVLHQEAGVRRDQHQAEKRRPQTDPQPELQIVEAVVSEERRVLGQNRFLLRHKSEICLGFNFNDYKSAFVCFGFFQTPTGGPSHWTVWTCSGLSKDMETFAETWTPWHSSVMV